MDLYQHLNSSDQVSMILSTNIERLSSFSTIHCSINPNRHIDEVVCFGLEDASVFDVYKPLGMVVKVGSPAIEFMHISVCSRETEVFVFSTE